MDIGHWTIDAVLMISFGGPEKREDIRPFLEEVTRGRRIPPERIDEVVHHYEKIGGASPLNAITFRQAEALQKHLNNTAPHPLPPDVLGAQGGGDKWRVYVGNRHWHPYLEDTLRKMAADGLKRAVGFVAAAYRTEASWERYLNAVEVARKKIGPSAPVIEYVNIWFDHPLFIQAIAARIREALSSNPAPGLRPPSPLGRGSKGEGLYWVYTAHSIPVTMANESHYVQELAHTAGMVSREFNVQDWTLAYTSRSGSPKEPWLEPDVCDMLRELARDDVKHVLLIPIGFIADHVEVLYDLDVEAKRVADELGIHLTRAQTVGDHPLFIELIADTVRKAASTAIPSPLAGEGEDAGALSRSTPHPPPLPQGERDV